MTEEQDNKEKLASSDVKTFSIKPRKVNPSQNIVQKESDVGMATSSGRITAESNQLNIQPKKLQISAMNVEHKAINGESTESNSEILNVDIKSKEIERELQRSSNIERCVACGKPLQGFVLMCPNCKSAKYHKKCLDIMAETETCGLCHHSFIVVNPELIIKRNKLEQFEKLLEHLDNQFKQNKIERDEYMSLAPGYWAKIKELKKEVENLK